MNKHVLSSCLLIVLIIAGCKKDDPQQQPPAPLPQLKLIKQTNNGGNPYNYFEEFIYDENKRVKEIKAFGINTDIVSRKFSFNGNQLEYRYYIRGTEQSNQALQYGLNNLGLIETQTSTYYKYKIIYEYNSAGYLVKTIYTNNNNPDGYVVHSYSSNHTLDSSMFYSNDGTVSYLTTFTYFSSKKNTIGNENKGLGFFGKDQQLLLKKESRFIYNHPQGMGIRVKYFENEYDYTYDNEGRVKTSTITRTDYPYPNGNSVFYIMGVYEHTYE